MVLTNGGLSWCLGVKLLSACAREKTDLWCGYGRERERERTKQVTRGSFFKHAMWAASSYEEVTK